MRGLEAYAVFEAAKAHDYPKGTIVRLYGDLYIRNHHDFYGKESIWNKITMIEADRLASSSTLADRIIAATKPMGVTESLIPSVGRHKEEHVFQVDRALRVEPVWAGVGEPPTLAFQFFTDLPDASTHMTIRFHGKLHDLKVMLEAGLAKLQDAL